VNARPYRFVIGVILALLVFLTPALVNQAYNTRDGHIAFGGEYLALPLIAAILLFAVETIKNLNLKERNNNGKSNSNHHR